MKFLAVTALLASAVSAATTTTAAAGASTSCAAENILQACLGTENDLLNSCGTNDWDCKCNAYGDIVTCYNNCPNDAGRDTAIGQQEIFCGYASQYPSPTSAAAAAAKTGTTTTGTNTGTTTGTGTGTATGSKSTSTTTATGTGTGTAASAAKTNSGAVDLVLNAGSMLVAVAGMVVALL